MRLLINSKYFLVLPRCPKPAEAELVRLYKLIHKELKGARAITRDARWNVVGVLTRRTP